MKFLHTIVGNSVLVLVLFAMLFLPIGAMGLSNVKPNNEVLSETSQREEIIPPQRQRTVDQQFEIVKETSESTDQRQEIDY